MIGNIRVEFYYI